MDDGTSARACPEFQIISDLAGKLSGYFGARYLAKERIFDSLISIFSALYIT